MSDVVLVAIIMAVPSTIAAVSSFLNGKAIAGVKGGQAKMAEALDGKLTKLMEAEKGVSKAEGVAQERDRVDSPSEVQVVNTPENPVPIMPTKTVNKL